MQHLAHLIGLTSATSPSVRYIPHQVYSAVLELRFVRLTVFEYSRNVRVNETCVTKATLLRYFMFYQLSILIHRKGPISCRRPHFCHISIFGIGLRDFTTLGLRDLTTLKDGCAHYYIVATRQRKLTKLDVDTAVSGAPGIFIWGRAIVQRVSGPPLGPRARRQ